MKSATMRYCGFGVISHEICNHDILGFWCNANISQNMHPWDIVIWCNISWNLQPWDIGFLVQYLTKSGSMRYCELVLYLMKSATMRYCGFGVISHKICNHEILWFWCNISWNLQPWDIVTDLIILMTYLIKYETTRYLIWPENIVII